MGGGPKTRKVTVSDGHSVARRLGQAALLGFGLVACSALEPVDLAQPAEVVKTPEQFASADGLQTQVTGNLLTLFGDPVLRAAVAESLDSNPDILQAAKRLELAGFDLTTTGADAWPQVSGNLNARRGNPSGESVSPTLDVSWEIDIWGRQADRRGAAQADKAAAAARYEATRVSVAAQMMQAWFTAIEARQQQQVEAQRLTGLRTQAENIRANYRSGIGSLDDLSAIERDVALSEAALAQRKGLHNDAVRAVELLLGQYPDNDLAIPSHLPRLTAAPAPGVPLAVLAARPDMRAAWQDAIAANKRIAVSQKELLPQISLTGQFGSTSADFSALSHGATIWSLASSLTAPIFEAGRRKVNIEASKTRADQALLTYLQTALTAFSEVERALDQESILSLRETRLAEAATHARATETTIETRYRAGLAGILDLLSAQNAVFDIQSQLLAVRADRLRNRAALGLALGKWV